MSTDNTENPTSMDNDIDHLVNGAHEAQETGTTEDVRDTIKAAAAAEADHRAEVLSSTTADVAEILKQDRLSMEVAEVIFSDQSIEDKSNAILEMVRQNPGNDTYIILLAASGIAFESAEEALDLILDGIALNDVRGIMGIVKLTTKLPEGLFYSTIRNIVKRHIRHWATYPMPLKKQQAAYRGLFNAFNAVKTITIGDIEAIYSEDSCLDTEMDDIYREHSCLALANESWHTVKNWLKTTRYEWLVGASWPSLMTLAVTTMPAFLKDPEAKCLLDKLADVPIYEPHIADMVAGFVNTVFRRPIAMRHLMQLVDNHPHVVEIYELQFDELRQALINGGIEKEAAETLLADLYVKFEPRVLVSE